MAKISRFTPIMVSCTLVLCVFLYRLWTLEKEERRRGILSVEHVKDTTLPVLRETFETESRPMVVNCNYKKINSVPGNIVLSAKLKGGYLDEMTNNVMDGMFVKNLKYDKKRHRELLDYYFENKDEMFKEKLGFYLSQKFDAFLKSISELREFRVKEIYITSLLQPDMRTSRSFYVNFDVLIHREEKNHGKHLKCLGEILDIRSLSSLHFKLVLYSVKVVGVVMEDKVFFDQLTDPYNTTTYEFLKPDERTHRF